MAFQTLDILEPPYRDIAPLTRATPQLGAVVVSRPSSSHHVPATLSDLFERAPWTVPCVIFGSGVTLSPALLHAMWGLPNQPAFVFLKAPGERTTASAVL